MSLTTPLPWEAETSQGPQKWSDEDEAAAWEAVMSKGVR